MANWRNALLCANYKASGPRYGATAAVHLVFHSRGDGVEGLALFLQMLITFELNFFLLGVRLNFGSIFFNSFLDFMANIGQPCGK